jgi:hypothetical protein
MKKFFVSGKGRYLALLLAVMFALSFVGCKGDDGSNGAPGKSTGTLEGTVTMSQTGDPVSGVTVAVSPSIQGVSITTGADGTYSADLPIGNYSVTYSKTNFASQTISVSIVAAQTATEDVALVATANVIVSASSSVASPKPGDTVSVTADVTALDGSAVQSVTWSQTNSVSVSIATPDAATTDVTLPGAEAYKTELFDVMVDPSTFEPGYIDILDRTIVQGVDPLSLEEAGAVTLTVTVVTGSGTYTDTVEIDADLSDSIQVNPGVDNVAIGLPVLLHGKDMGGGFSWALTTPGGSAATLDSATSQNPSFRPDVAGQYVATLTNGAGGALTNTVTIYAGTWLGIITGQDVGGERTTDPTCSACHTSGGIAPDKFTPWKKSGHSEIFTDNVNNPAGHYSTSCFPCHTVGYNLTDNPTNNGFDDQADYQTFLDQFTTNGAIHGAVDNWTKIVSNTPNTAREANIQCENCHGPQGSAAHMQVTPRVSLAAEVCGSCHGEPPRHGRYQQWKESGHSNVELAIGEGTRGSCAPCHSANGFVEWSENAFDPNFTPTVTWTEDSVQPQTCAACHPPHDPGSTTGKPNNAIVRVEDNTPLTKGGFMATGVGRGATCMMCHNNRRGGYNTSSGMLFGGNFEMIDETPHHGPQGDVLMGENAFFVTVGDRSPHSFITDTCTNCHMELTLPPAEFSYEGGGTNHTFEASLTICGNCHGVFDGGTLQASVAALQVELGTAMTTALQADINNIAGQVSAVLVGPDDANADGVIDPNPANGEVDAVITTANSVTAVTQGSRGRFNITLTDATSVSNASYSSIVVWKDDNADGVIQVAEVYEGDTDGEGIVDTCIGAGVSYASTADALANCTADGGVLTNGQNIAKANWNWVLIDQDASGGIHNPDFVVGLENASIAALR